MEISDRLAFQLEMANGRSPNGRPWKGLTQEQESTPGTEDQYRRLAYYTKLIRRDVDHQTAYYAAYRINDDWTEKRFEALIESGTLVLG